MCCVSECVCGIIFFKFNAETYGRISVWEKLEPLGTQAIFKIKFVFTPKDAKWVVFLKGLSSRFNL